MTKKLRRQEQCSSHQHTADQRDSVHEDRRFSRRRVLKTAAGIGIWSSAGVTSIGTVGAAAGGDLQWQFDAWENDRELPLVSSPTVVDGTVFFMGDRTTYALDAVSGDTQWIHDVGGSFAFASTPTVVDNTVFVPRANTGIDALTADTGDWRWRYIGDESWNACFSPTVVDGTVFCAIYEGDLFALDADPTWDNGKHPEDALWRVSLPSGSATTPTVVNGTLFVGGVEDALYAVDAETGEYRWRLDAGSDIRAGVNPEFGEQKTSPTVSNGVVFAGSDNNHIDDHIYALDAADGTERWSFETGGSIRSSPTVADGTVFVGSWDGNVYALDAADGTERWSFKTGDAIQSSATVASGSVFVGSNDDHVYALDAADGTERWSFETGDAVPSSPTVVDGTVYVGSYDGNLYALDAGVSGSSEGTRVNLGTLGHHDEWAQRSQRETLDIVAADPDSDDETLEDDGLGPGFGVAGSVAGVGGASYLLKRRLDGTDTASRE